jgi:hypothetical protein
MGLKNANCCPLRRVLHKFTNRNRLVITSFGESLSDLVFAPVKLEPDAKSVYFCVL